MPKSRLAYHIPNAARFEPPRIRLEKLTRRSSPPIFVALDIAVLGPKDLRRQPVAGPLLAGAAVDEVERLLRVRAPGTPETFHLLLQPTHARAFLKIRSHGPSSPRWGGRQEYCTARTARSGCGIMIVTRPSGVVTPVTPASEPLGLAG